MAGRRRRRPRSTDCAPSTASSGGRWQAKRSSNSKTSSTGRPTSILSELRSIQDGPKEQDLERSVIAYLQAVRDEFAALEAGDRNLAMEIDEEAVDPRFDETLSLRRGSDS